MENTTVSKASTTVGLISMAIVVGFGMFLVGFDANLFFFGGAFIFGILHVNAFLLGVASSGFAIGITIFSLIGGYVFDRITTRNGILISLAIISLFSSLTGFASNAYEVVIFRFLVGFGTGMIQPQISAFLGDMRPKIRATLIATAGVFFNLGLFAGPLVFAGFSTLNTFDIPFIIAGVSGLALMGITVALVPSKYKSPEKPMKGILKNMNRSLLLASVSYMFFGIAFFAFESYITPYFIFSGLNKGTAALALSSFGIAGIILAYPGGMAGDRFNRKRLIQLGIAMIFLGSVVMFAFHVTFTIALMGVVLFGGGYAIYGNIQAFSQESVEDAWIGTAVGFLFTIFNIGAIIGGPLMGIVSGAYGYQLGGTYAIIVPLAVAIAVMTVAPAVAKRASTLQEQQVPA
ncbi:MAG: MFS transporter [Candidatus Thermoplasmatota archaeon]|jgi:MFS family permease|nr:MFS transporter [Candidatus Thermoplasmatota archaeon]